jgi:hypothetical protein
VSALTINLVIDDPCSQGFILPIATTWQEAKLATSNIDCYDIGTVEVKKY